ncbi:hypothetical protein M758_7G155300 [Ceratodon purpureus]|nr:hypothetical protein M758_7G155300 [Ceratodon purpureus]
MLRSEVGGGVEAMTVGEVAPEAWEPQGVVLVVLDLTMAIDNAPLQWALESVVRKGDILRVIGLLTHVLNPLGYKCRLDQNSWTGANRKILEAELANKRYMLHNIKDLHAWCEAAEVKLAIEVRAGPQVHKIVVDEAKSSGAYHVVLDKTMKKEKKYYIDNLTCFVTRMRASGGVDSIRSFALSNQQPQLTTSAAPTPFNTQSTSYLSAIPSFSKTSSSNDSLRGSSVSSTTFNHDLKEHNDRMGPPTKRDSIGLSSSSGTSTSSLSFDALSCDDLFSINHEAASERDVFEPLATMALNSKSNADDPKHSAPGLSSHSKGSGAQVDDTPKNSRPSSPRKSKRLVVRTSLNKSSSFSRATSVCSPLSRTSSGCVGSARAGLRQAATAKTVWVWTTSKDVMTASVEGGWSTFIFTPETKDLANEWTSLARIDPLYLESNQFLDSEKKQVAVLGQVSSGEQLESLPALMGKADVVVMNALDWQIIPAENMVAAFQEHGGSTALYATANSAIDAQVYLEALEKGTDGVVLHTDDPAEVFALKAYLKERQDAATGVALVEATVTQVESVGMGDRVCVDLCNLLNPGEGLLVGSFARALFLVHSECLESNYVASRPFRVNAGPVHAYVGMAGGRTAYLSELHTGSQVLVVDATGRSRTVLVGRVKIESRPLLLIEVDVDGQRHSVLLQNAETVCLVSPGENKVAKALPVTSLKVGDKLLLSLQEEARHTGIQIQEFVVEK